jgi:hypothetical protein
MTSHGGYSVSLGMSYVALIHVDSRVIEGWVLRGRFMYGKRVEVGGKEWIRLRKIGFEPTTLSRSETMCALFVHISYQFRGLKSWHVCSEGSGSTPW